jgi:hypothetical protein
MSNSMINEVVKVHKKEGQPDEYTVTGLIGDQRAQQGPGSVPDVHVRVMIWQTKRDIGLPETTTHAFAMSDANVVARNGEPIKWTATMTHRKFLRGFPDQELPEFDLNSRATGFAVSVDCTDDPAGFEIDTWIGPISFEEVTNATVDPTS